MKRKIVSQTVRKSMTKRVAKEDQVRQDRKRDQSVSKVVRTYLKERK